MSENQQIRERQRAGGAVAGVNKQEETRDSTRWRL